MKVLALSKRKLYKRKTRPKNKKPAWSDMHDAIYLQLRKMQ